MTELEEWKVVDDGRGQDDIVANGNRLLIGNGYLGYRGTVDEADASHLAACNLAGVYDRRGDLWREPVNAPNGLYVALAAASRGPAVAEGSAAVQPGGVPEGAAFSPLGLADERLLSHAQALDFRYGIYSRSSSWSLGEAVVSVESRRFASMADPHLICLEYRVRADRPTALHLKLGIDAAVWDINGPHLETFAFAAGAGQGGPAPAAGSGAAPTYRSVASLDSRSGAAGRLELSASASTQELGVALSVASISEADFEASSEIIREERGIYRLLSFEAEAGREYSLRLYAAVATGIDAARESSCEPGAASGAAGSGAALRGDREAALRLASNSARRAALLGFDSALAAQEARWERIWEACDVEIEGDDRSRRALRYSIYQLEIIAPRHASGLSIPARGLSGQTYKGAVFWDTEMFIAPLFLYTEPEVARSFIKYRIGTLDGARRKAAEYGYRGAFYAWESQETGDDACSHFNVVDVFTGRPMRTYFRDKQVHISADVARSIKNYIEVTGDESILAEGGLEVVLECARFFLSYAYYSPERGRYEILDVTGPDEYHERVNNDAFTSRMVKETFDIALAYVELMRARDPELLARVVAKIGFERDLGSLSETGARLYVPAPGKDGVIEQFDGYFKLEDCGLDDLRSRLLDPKEYWGGANGVATSTRIIKQADVVLMLDLFGEDYDQATKLANLRFYEPRTEHGSSLSHCLYSLLACETGDSEWAYPFFRKTAEIDIAGEGKQYAGLVYIGGSHPAASGGAWMAAIIGFCGLSVESGELKLRPRLPESWSRLSFSLRFRGVDYRATVEKGGYRLEKREGSRDTGA